MFSILPPNYHPNYSSLETITSFVTGSSKLLVPGKVTAFASIPEGLLSGGIDPGKLLGQPDIVQISAKINSEGIIDLANHSKHTWGQDTHWVRAIRLSDDCHSYNIQLGLQKNQKSTTLILQTVRPIEAGQELLLWFTEDVLALMQIAFLTPANIQGQKKYVCNKCSALYESPNPLKLHITLSCGRYEISSLWEKLCNELRESSVQQINNSTPFDFKLSTIENQIIRQRNAIDLSLSSRPELYRPFNTDSSSAFKPFEKTQAYDLTWPNGIDQQHHHLQQLVHEDEAHIETLVSSLGKSKQGHICLYCGKCYSRKYGLKIHIRTHTGYKPLKCKFCMRPFGDPSNLNKHVRLHAEGNTPYKCDLCGKILVRRRDLDRHLKSRHMIEMHPGLNILQDESTQDKDLKCDEPDKFDS